MAEAVRLGHNYVGTEHLLMGLLRESDCFAARMLAACGVEAQRLYMTVLGMLGPSPRATRKTSPPLTAAAVRRAASAGAAAAPRRSTSTAPT